MSQWLAKSDRGQRGYEYNNITATSRIWTAMRGKSKQFTETSDHYRLHFEMNDNFVKQNTQKCNVFHEYTKQNILD